MNILITGGSKGIGNAIACHFAGKGHQVAICSRDPSHLDQSAGKILAKTGQNIITIACDMSDIDEIERMHEQLQRTWNCLDVLVNNAGVYQPGQLLNEEEGMIEKLFSTNVCSAYHCTRKFYPLLLKSNCAHIFNIISVAGNTVFPNSGSYGISKFALNGFSKILREELKKDKIRVTAVLPGATHTSSWENENYPRDFFMEPEDIAEMIYAAWKLPAKTVVEELIMRPLRGDVGG